MIGLVDILYPYDSEQAGTARRFAAQCLDRATAEGYHIVSIDFWRELVYQEKREDITNLADKLIEYARYRLGDTEACSVEAQKTAQGFLAMCRAYGACLLSLRVKDFGVDLNRFRGRCACASISMN